MATYHITTTGVDSAGRDGLSTGTAWATLSYACTRVSGTNTIYIHNGSYTWSSQSVVPINVSIEGESEDGVIITCNYAGSFLLLQTSSGWLGTYGNQTISKITIDGNATGTTAIVVNYRSNIIIDQCTIYDFQNNGIIFYGMPLASWGGVSVFEPNRSMPNYWCSGNKVTHCTLTNNVNSGSDSSNIRVGQQNGIEIAYNTITQPAHGSAMNCGGIKFYDEGWNKNMTIHHNTIDVKVNLNNPFNFALELWFILGGDEYYSNTIKGTIDIDCAYKGNSTYSIWIHDNDIGYDTYQNKQQNGIDIEANCYDLLIERNYIHHFSTGIYFSQIWPIGGSGRDAHPYDNKMERITIRCNKIVYIGMNNGTSDWEPIFGIMCGRDSATASTSYLNYIYIYNNTIVCGSITPDSYYTIGIWLPNTNTVVNYFYIYNNIIANFTGGDYAGAVCGRDNWSSSNDINYLYVYTNIMYGNGGYGNTVHFDTNYTVSPYYHDTIITTNPNLNSSFEIQSTGSSAYHAGTDLGITYDVNYELWHSSTPSIGADELVDNNTINISNFKLAKFSVI